MSECPTCGSTFEPKTKKQIYCQRDCARLKLNRRYYARKKAGLPQRDNPEPDAIEDLQEKYPRFYAVMCAGPKFRERICLRCRQVKRLDAGRYICGKCQRDNEAYGVRAESVST